MTTFDADEALAALDGIIGRQLEAILQHPSLVALERAWHTLAFVVERVSFEENILLSILSCSDDEMRADLRKEGAALQQIFEEPYRQGGGIPFGFAVVLFTFGHRDLDILGRLAGVGAQASSPIVAEADDSLIQAGADERWAALRQRDDSRYLVLTTSRFALDSERRPWLSAGAALAVCAANSFARYRWCPNIVGATGGGLVDGVLEVEPSLSEGRAYEIGERGFTALLPQGDGKAVFAAVSSIRAPKFFGTSEEARDAELNHRLDGQLPYTFIVSRLSQIAKVLWRDELLAGTPRAAAASELNAWLNRFVADSRVGSAAYRQRHPLQKVKLVVDEGEPRRFTLRVRPHFKYLGAFFALSAEGVLDDTSPCQEERATASELAERLSAMTPLPLVERLERYHDAFASFTSDGGLVVAAFGGLFVIDLTRGLLRARRTLAHVVEQMVVADDVITLAWERPPHNQLGGITRLRLPRGESPTDEVLSEILIHDRLWVLDMAASLAVVSYYDDSRDEPHGLAVLETESGSRRDLLAGRVTAACLTADGARLAAASTERTLDVHRVSDMRLERRFPPESSRALAFDSAGLRLASGGATIRTWRMDDGRELDRLHAASLGSAERLAFSPCGRWLASSHSAATVLWDLSTSRPRHVFGPQHEWVTALSFSPDGETLLVTTSQSAFRLWATDTGALRGSVSTARGELVLMAPDGRYKLFGRSGESFRLRLGEERRPLGAPQRLAVDAELPLV